MKEYRCIKCNRLLNYKPIRLTKEEYGAGRYNQYYPVEHYDFCKRCYEIFDKWLKKDNKR